MPSLADLQAYRDTLRSVRYSGVLTTIDQNGERVTFRSDAEMARAIAAVDAEIAALSGTPNTIRFTTSKGLC